MLRPIEDVKTVFAKDPAARNIVEVLTCYPGLHAIWFHRLANVFWRVRLRLLSRLVSHLSRFLTGIEIHPGAAIGRRFFIDHGMGVVIGETSEIGDDVLIYQGVVLGGTTLQKKKRHPTLGNGVVVGAGAILLGSIKIGEGARVGAGSVVLSDVAPNTVVVGVPARPSAGVTTRGILDLEHDKLPDPVAAAISLVLSEYSVLSERLKKLEHLEGVIGEMDRKIEEKHEEVTRLFTNRDGGGFGGGAGI